MQPIRHALGGLLLEQGYIKEAEDVFREDLKLHPRNPWSLVGLIDSLKRKEGPHCSCTTEIAALEQQLIKQREVEMADFEVKVACACCQE